jgi:hypothetical protein
MALEDIPESVNSDDNLRITVTELTDNPLSAAILAAGIDLTYSLKTWNLAETQDTVEDKRLSLSQNLKRPGRKNVTLEVQYVFGHVDDVAAATLVEGFEGHATVRYSVDNATDWAAAQVADVVRFKAGAQRKDAPVENGVQTITQELYVTGVVDKDAAIVE